MAKITIPDIASQFASQEALNARFTQVENELNNKVLYRDNPVGEPNAMAQELDMNSNRVINLPEPVNPNDAARLQDVTTSLLDPESVIQTQTEAVTLTAGQTTVVFAAYETTGSSFNISGPNTDDARLVLGRDFSVTNSTTILLTQSYPAGTLIQLLRNKVAGGGDTIVLEAQGAYDTVAQMEGSWPEVGELVSTKGYSVAGDGGGASYLIQSSSYVALAGDATLANGNVAELQINGEANVLKFGAKGNGSFNDSQAIRDAFARFSRNVVFDGDTLSNYNYADATGVSVFSDPSNIRITNKSRKVIAINDACYLINLSAPINTFAAKGVNTINGLGFYRNTWAGANVLDQFIVEDCVFMDYKQCAISEESTDHPYVLIRNNIFRGDFSSQTIGVSLSGLQDTNIVEMNKFQANYIHLRVPALSGSLTVRNNGFINLNAGSTKLADIWVVPQDEGTTINGAGVGTLFHANRHGIENQSATDSKIIIANSLTGGTDVALPDTTTRTGYVTGFIFDSNRVAGGTSWTGAFIKSYITQFRNNTLDNTTIQSYGGMSYLVDFEETPTQSFQSYNVIKNTVYPAFNPTVDNIPLTNGFSDVDDSFYQSVGRDFNKLSNAKVDTKVIYKNHDTANSGFMSNTTRTAVLNPQYPALNTAAELTMGGANAHFGAYNGTLPVSQMLEGRYINIELDAAQGDTNSASNCFIVLNDVGNGVDLAKFNIKLTSDFQRHSFRIKMLNTTYTDLRFKIFVSDYTPTTNKIKIANIDINMSYTNINTTHLSTTGNGGFDNPHIKLGDYNLWVDSTGTLRIKSTEPTSDTDGIIVGTQT